jgi:hypothetical protein
MPSAGPLVAHAEVLCRIRKRHNNGLDNTINYLRGAEGIDLGSHDQVPAMHNEAPA